MEMMLGDSPMVTGSWFNPKTGDAFTVRDSFFEDNSLVVMTTDGRRIDYNMLQQYVQSDKPLTPQEIAALKQRITGAAPQNTELPPEIAGQLIDHTAVAAQQAQAQAAQPAAADPNDAFLTEEDKALIYGTRAEKLPENANKYPSDQPTQRPELKLPATTTEEDEDEMLVRRMLKRSVAPSVNCKISWKDFPRRQMEMLDTMAVDPEKIADFYMKDIDLVEIRAAIKEQIITTIEKELAADPNLTIKTSKRDDAPTKPLESPKSLDPVGEITEKVTAEEQKAAEAKKEKAASRRASRKSKKTTKKK